MQAKKVLVTGARGFVGRHALPALRKLDFEVVALAGPKVNNHRTALGATEAGPWAAADSWVRADLLDRSAVSAVLDEVRPSHLLHLAWITERGRYWDAEENLDWMHASLQLFRSARASGCTRMLFVGSCAEYGPSSQLCDENDSQLAPSSMYGVSKDALRRVLETEAQLRGPSLTWARLFFPYGPHDAPERLIPYVIRSLLAGSVAECSSGTQVRDLLHIEDVASALASLLDSRVEGAVNIASGEGRSIAQVLERLGALMDKPHLIQLGAKPSQSHDADRWVASTKRLREELGWVPSRDLDQGLEHTIDWVGRQ